MAAGHCSAMRERQGRVIAVSTSLIALIDLFWLAFWGKQGCKAA